MAALAPPLHSIIHCLQTLDEGAGFFPGDEAALNVGILLPAGLRQVAVTVMVVLPASTRDGDCLRIKCGGASGRGTRAAPVGVRDSGRVAHEAQLVTGQTRITAEMATAQTRAMVSFTS